MPAKSEFMTQPAAGVLGLREKNRSHIACRDDAAGPLGRLAAQATRARVGGNGALLSARGARENTTTGALRSARGACENANTGALRSARGACENANTGTGRRSPRRGNFTTSKTSNINNRPLSAGTRRGVLGDITNVTAGRSSFLDKAKPMQRSFSFQPSVSAAAEETHRLLAAYPAACEQEAGERGTASVADMQIEKLYIASTIGRKDTPHDKVILGSQVDGTEMDVQNPQEYKVDIVNQLFSEESAFLPRADYMTTTQTDLAARMRTILVDWLVEVHMKYKLRLETLHLTINLVDRYLTRMPVIKNRLQLVGVTAMFIASKFEEINPPELHSWVYIADNAYTKEDILVLECTMLTSLSFRIAVPTAAHFLPILQEANGCDALHRDVTHYLLELGLLDIVMLQYAPSQTVAAAIVLSNELLKRSALWPAKMVQQSRHTEEALRACVDDLRRLLEADRAGSGGQLQAVHKKFLAQERHGVATMQF